MSRTDKTKPYWVRIAEHHPVPVHRHERGVCDLPETPYINPGTVTGCHWDANLLNSCCAAGCNCWGCTRGYAGKYKRRRDRYAGKAQIRAGEDYDTIERSGPGRPARWRRDTQRWCKGRYGREHRPVVQVANWAGYLLERGYVCHPSTWGGRSSWRCYHELACQSCGKILQHALDPQQCPVYQHRQQKGLR